ncbi:membrane steroid-binding protein 1-like [Telopea speciosissima]|uniref:membrane steroid-binding protein 1-like n=1 Tax=Telopea speciosissima TaxID=54955 RepID=UPI001CC70724|nr:membrane steroid-binding protein 1-like [Telopea speciosissima]
MEASLQPLQLGEITEEELKAYDGSDPNKPLLIAIKGQVFDVSSNKRFYGPNGPYGLLSGKDASRGLATMSFKEKDLNGDISGLSLIELDNLQDWQNTFKSKYIRVGTIKKIKSLPLRDILAYDDAAQRVEDGLPVNRASTGPSELVDAKSVEDEPIAVGHVEERQPKGCDYWFGCWPRQ